MFRIGNNRHANVLLLYELRGDPCRKGGLPRHALPHRPAPSQMILLCPGASRARITVRQGSSFRAWMSWATSKLLHSSPCRTVTLPAFSKAGATHLEQRIPVNTIIQDYSISIDEYKREKSVVSALPVGSRAILQRLTFSCLQHKKLPHTAPPVRIVWPAASSDWRTRAAPAHPALRQDQPPEPLSSGVPAFPNAAAIQMLN